MSSKTRRPAVKPGPKPDDFEQLYLRLLHLMYEKDDPAKARPVAVRLERLLTESADHSESIRGDEVRAMIAELRGDLTAAARCREAEIRKILQLHALTANTPHWEFVSRQYDFADVSDRLDLLAILYDQQGDTERAVATLHESKRYCASHGIPFDGQDVLDELTAARAAG